MGVVLGGDVFSCILCYFDVGIYIGGGGGGGIFLAFYAILTFSRNKILGKVNFRKTILFHLMFSLCFFMLDLLPTFFFKY